MKRIGSKALVVIIFISAITLAVLPSVFTGRSAGVVAYAYEIEYTPGYGYDSMSSGMKGAYDDMENDIETMLTLGTNVTSKKQEHGDVSYRALSLSYLSADYEGISVDELKMVYTTLKMLHPEYYFLPNLVLVYSSDKNPGIELAIIDEFASPEAREETDNKIERVKSEILSDVPDDAPASEAARIIYGAIQSYMSYAYDEAGFASEAHTAHSIIGALPEYGSAVCEGISKWFSYLLLEEGIENYIVTGIASSDGISEIGGANHSWNVLKLENGKWYDFDLTWDINFHDKYGVVSYQYFAMASGDFDRDHHRERTGYDSVYLYETPEAENSYFYNVYIAETNRLNFADRSAFIELYTKMWERALGAGDRYIIFYVGNTVNSTLARSYVRSFTVTAQVQKNVTSDGYPDQISYIGTAQLQDGKLLCVSIDSSMYCKSALRHSFTGKIPTAEHRASAATCSARATYYYVCEFCGEQGDDTYEYGDYSNDHKLSGTSAKAATCTTDGNIAYWYCSRCKRYFDSKNATHEIALSETVIKAEGHSYQYEQYNADSHKMTCVHGDSTAYGDHEYEVTDISGEGRYVTLTYTCVLCGYSYTTETDNCAGGHTYGEWLIGEDGHYRVCSVCGESSGVSRHTLTAVSESEKSVTYSCVVCGYTEERTKETGTTTEQGGTDQPVTGTSGGKGDDPAQHVHSYGEWQAVDDEYHAKYCVCGESVSEKHVWIVTDAVTDGDQRRISYECTQCGYTMQENEEITKNNSRVFLIVGLLVSTLVAAGAAVGLVVIISRRKKLKDS